MRRILGSLVSLIVYVCVGTVMAQGIVLAYFWTSGLISGPKSVEMLSIAYGIELEAEETGDEEITEEASTEQPSFDAVLERRAARSRDIELKKQALGNYINENTRLYNALRNKEESFTEVVERFRESLEKEDNKREKEAIDDLREIFSSTQPKAAKEQLLRMWKQGDTQTVVSLLTGMPAGRQKKIIQQFKTPEDHDQLQEIIQHIYKNRPELDLIRDAKEQIGQR